MDYKTITNIEDPDSILKLIDPYQDWNGNMRAGQLIGNYFKYCDKGFNRDLSLKKAVSDFRNEWGNDKVSSNGNYQNHSGNDLWRKVFENI